ncbi:MAG: hypothetical protein Q7R40_15275 [Phaeospirillum sp.]|nr:hypothetical protein [Phaeospirillum sp.]
MRAQQVHYTSCRRGTSNGAGIQVRSFTPGVAADELQEIVRRGNYSAPPRRTEDAAEAPVALRQYPLANGRVAVTRSAYSGTDYSGRDGNFMAHTLVFEPGELKVRPLDLYEWGGWKKCLDPAEDTEEVPPPLPVAEISQPLSMGFDPRAFLADQPGAREILIDVARAMFLVAPTGRRIVIRDTSHTNWKWIACLHRLFPLKHISGLTVSSFQHSQADCAHVNATIDGTYFSFNDSQLNFEYFMFDLVSGRRSPIPDVEPKLNQEAVFYAERVVSWLIDQPEYLARFDTFMAGYTHQSMDIGLAIGLRLFQMQDQQVAPPDWELAPIVDFVADFASPDSCRAAVEALPGIMASLRARGRPEDFSALIKLCLKAAEATGDTQLAAEGAAIWVQMFDELIVIRNQESQAVASAWALVVQSGQARTAARIFLAEGHLALIEPHYGRLDAAPLRVVAENLYAALRASSPQQAIGTCIPAKSLVVAVAGRPASGSTNWLSEILLPLENDAESIAALLRYAAEINLPSTAAAMLSTWERRPSLASAVRKQLDQSRQHELLMAEFRLLMAAARDKRKFFSEYSSGPLKTLPGFSERNLTTMTDLLWREVGDRDRTQLALDWLNDPGWLRWLSEDVQRQMAGCLNREVSLQPSDSGQRFAAAVADLAASLELRLVPDRPAIRRLLAQCLQAGKLTVDSLAHIEALLSELDKADYRLALSILLPLSLVGSASVHAEACVRLYQKPRQGEFCAEYLRIFDGKSAKKDVLRLLAVAAAHWLTVDASALREPITDGLAKRLARHRDRDVATTLNQIAASLAATSEPKATKRYREFDETVARYQESLPGKVRSFVRRMIDRLVGRTNQQ